MEFEMVNPSNPIQTFIALNLHWMTGSKALSVCYLIFLLSYTWRLWEKTRVPGGNTNERAGRAPIRNDILVEPFSPRQWELSVLYKDIRSRFEPTTNTSVGECSTNWTTTLPKALQQKRFSDEWINISSACGKNKYWYILLSFYIPQGH